METQFLAGISYYWLRLKYDEIGCKAPRLYCLKMFNKTVTQDFMQFPSMFHYFREDVAHNVVFF